MNDAAFTYASFLSHSAKDKPVVRPLASFVRTHPRHFAPIAVAFLALSACSLVIQPVSAASWVPNSPLLTARYNHTATLLPSGRVLVAGGWNGSYLSSAELFDPATGKWTATGTMTTSRCYHSATLLPNGKVVVVGGYSDASPQALTSAELYDPATGTWTNTGSMSVGRVYHTATLLADGRLLVAGGPGNTAEVYDPTRGTWTNTGAMSRARWYHTATLLTNGSVLVAGGDFNYLPPGFFPTAEVYNPLSGTWATTEAMTTNRTSPTATLLPDGKVLVAGGWLMAQVQTNPPAYSSFSLPSAELFDPATGDWTPTTNTMVIGRNYHTASLLPNGQVLLVSGFVNGPGDTARVELFDSVSGAWIATTNMLNVARSDHTATLLPGGRILVAGGIGRDGVTNSTELYDLANGEWAPTNSLVSPQGGRNRHTVSLLPDGKVLVAGGFNGGYHLTGAELYHPATGTWTATGRLNNGRGEHTATLLPNGKVLVAGGDDNTDHSLREAEIYDPATEEWTSTGNLATARHEHTATLLPNGKVLVTGGFMIYGGSLSSAELYDPATGEWTTTGSMSVVRLWHTATLLANGKVLIAGGQGQYGDLFHSSAELYDPAAGTWTATGSMTTTRGDHTATLLANGKVLVTAGWNYTTGFLVLSSAELYDPTTGTWTPTGSLNTARVMHESSLLLDGRVLTVGGYNNGYLRSVELYDTGLEAGAQNQPQIAVTSSPLELGNSLIISGSQFRGISGASGGGTQDSPTDYPVVQLRSIESGQTTFLLTTNWSANSFTSLPVWNFPAGWALATVFANGIPSASGVVKISVPVATATSLTSAKMLASGSLEFAFTNSPGALFGVLATTNVALPTTNWTALGGVTEIAPGQFRFADTQAANNRHRFYRVRSR